MSTASADVFDPAPVDTSDRFAWRHNRWLRGLAAVLAGVLTGLAWQPYGLWPLLLIGIPALTLLVRDGDLTRPRRSAFGIGFLYGLGLLGVSISWIHVLGSWIAVLLIAFEALFFGLLGLTLHLTVGAALVAAGGGAVLVVDRVPLLPGPVRWVRLGPARVRGRGHARWPVSCR